MKRFSGAAVVGSILLLSACSSAPKQHEVSASYVPVTRYEHYSCDQMLREAEAIRSSIPALEAAVDQHRSSQTGVEIVTWLLFWPAAFALDKGTEYSQPLAEARGEIKAIESAMLSKNCGHQLAATESDMERLGVSEEGDPSLPSSANASMNNVDVSIRLRALEQLHEDGLLTQDEYAEKRREILGLI